MASVFLTTVPAGTSDVTAHPKPPPRFNTHGFAHLISFIVSSVSGTIISFKGLSIRNVFQAALHPPDFRNCFAVCCRQAGEILGKRKQNYQWYRKKSKVSDLSLNPWNTVMLEKPSVDQLYKEFPRSRSLGQGIPTNIVILEITSVNQLDKEFPRTL